MLKWAKLFVLKFLDETHIDVKHFFQAKIVLVLVFDIVLMFELLLLQDFWAFIFIVALCRRVCLAFINFLNISKHWMLRIRQWLVIFWLKPNPSTNIDGVVCPFCVKTTLSTFLWVVLSCEVNLVLVDTLFIWSNLFFKRLFMARYPVMDWGFWSRKSCFLDLDLTGRNLFGVNHRRTSWWIYLKLC